MRLAIVSALAVNESLSFNELKRLLETTDGNLSVHARKLEEAGYIVCTKIVRGPRAADRLPPERRRPARARALPVAHGSADPRDPRALSGSLFLRSNFMQQSTSHPATPAAIHVGIIMDGNGRWATAQGRSRAAGHRAGAAMVRRIVEAAPDCGIGVLTLFAFSADNWRRPADRGRLAHAALPGVPPRRDRALRGQRGAAGDHRPARPPRRRAPARDRGRAPRDGARHAAAPPDRARLLLARRRCSAPRSVCSRTRPRPASRSGG